MLAQVLAPAAQAATAFDLVISGPGMHHPVTLRWDQAVGAITKEAFRHGATINSFIPFFHPAVELRGFLGPAYDLKALTFIPGVPPRGLGTEHWTYYPRRDVVRLVDHMGRASWGQPVPAFRAVIDGAIAAGKGRSVFVLALAGTLVFLVMLAEVLVLRRRRRATASDRADRLQPVGA